MLAARGCPCRFAKQVTALQRLVNAAMAAIHTSELKQGTTTGSATAAPAAVAGSAMPARRTGAVAPAVQCRRDRTADTRRPLHE